MNNIVKPVMFLSCFWLLSGCEVFDDDDDNKSAQKTTSSMSSMASSSSEAAKVYTSVRGGAFSLTEAGEALYDSFGGEANLTVSDQDSMVEVMVWGLSPSETYNTHVHDGWCASGGGGHYLQNTEGEDVAGNGLWPLLEADESGKATTIIWQQFAVDDRARSVVIHQPGSGDRVACADLVPSTAIGGMLELTDRGDELYSEVSGYGYVSVVNNSWSKAEVSVSGLTGDTTYATHVHVGDCASGGGAHYLQDGELEDEAANGLWPAVTTDAWGNGAGWASNSFAVRTDETKSIVMHQPESGDRIACIDLNMDMLLIAFRSGGFEATDDGEALYGEGAITGRATLKITSEGMSSAKVMIRGLASDTAYSAHVHNKSCSEGGGAHYLQTVVDGDVAENGLFPYFTTNTNGYGVGMAEQNFVVRADARSVVVHEPGTGARIACADLR